MHTNIDIPAACAAGLTSIAQLETVLSLAQGPETMKTLAVQVGRSTAALTQVADKLETLGLARRVHGSQDRRAVWLKLTEKGEQAAARILEPQPAAVS